MKDVLTKRDQFAIAALRIVYDLTPDLELVEFQGDFDENGGLTEGSGFQLTSAVELMIDNAYRVADAMMKASEEK